MYHQAVLAVESVNELAIQPDGVYVDVTFGGGGHSRLIMDQLGPDGKLLAFDQDPDAEANVPADNRLKFLPYNFRHLKRILRMEGVEKVDGVLADLGVSSHQFDTPERGFSFRFEAELDMRMGQTGTQTAATILNTYDAGSLQSLFSKYGEVRNARTLANEIVETRRLKDFETIGDFLQVAERLARGGRSKYLAQVFQALRIEVNDEMGALAEMLEAALDVLNVGGRMVVISYHSLEDRMVKNFFKTGNIEGEVKKDFYGNIHRPFRLITKKARMPEAAEIEQNPRARSARLRVAEKSE